MNRSILRGHAAFPELVILSRINVTEIPGYKFEKIGRLRASISIKLSLKMFGWRSKHNLEMENITIREHVQTRSREKRRLRYV